MKHIEIPAERYNFFRESLRSGYEARKEIIRHVAVLVEEEILRHQDAWDELAKIAGFTSMQDMHKQGYILLIDWHTRLIKKQKRVIP